MLPVPYQLPASQRFGQAASKALALSTAVIVAQALRRHGAVMRADPEPDYFWRTVDGVAGLIESAVKPGGRIHYKYSRIKIVLESALETLRALSPVRSGDYRDHHFVYVNGQRVDDLVAWSHRPGDTILITNEMPYARVIEVGVMKMRVPGTDHVYAQAETIVRRQYNALADVRFTYTNVLGGRDARAPALIVTEL